MPASSSAPLLWRSTEPDRHHPRLGRILSGILLPCPLPPSGKSAPHMRRYARSGGGAVAPDRAHSARAEVRRPPRALRGQRVRPLRTSGGTPLVFASPAPVLRAAL